MPPTETVAPWFAAFIVFFVLLFVAIRTPHDIEEYQQLRESRETSERIAFFGKWLRESFLLYTVSSLVVLLAIGRIDALSSLPQEFVTAQNLLNIGDAPVETVSQDVSFFNVLGLITGFVLAILLGLLLNKAVAIGGSKLKIKPPDIEPLIPRNGRERFAVIALAINASFGEEFFFRLVLPMTLVMIGVPALPAFAVTIIIFGLVHLYQGWVGVLLTAFVGCMLTYAYLRAGSIWTPVAIHFLINIIGLVIRPTLSRLFGAGGKETN